MPITPGCHPSPDSTTDRRPDATSAGARSITSAATRSSNARRRRLNSSSLRATACARPSSSASKSSNAYSAWPRRPAALILGQRTNARCQEVTGASIPASAVNAANPGDNSPGKAARPPATRERFSPSRSTTSQTVPNATNGKSDEGSSARPPSLIISWASLKATPTPARLRAAWPSGSRWGETTAFAGGSVCSRR